MIPLPLALVVREGAVGWGVSGGGAKEWMEGGLGRMTSCNLSNL